MSTSPTPPTRHWGTSPTPPEPKPKRSGRILLAAAIGVALLVVTAVVANGSTTDNRPTPTPPTTPSPDPSPIPDPPTTTTSPDPEPKTEVTDLTGMTRTEAKQVLVGLGLKVATRYKFTDQAPAGTVISQSPKAGAEVLPGTTVSLVVAKTPSAPPPPPPPPSTAPPPPPPTAPASSCDPSYPDVCLDPAVGDYDCAGGTGNGPGYVEGPIRVRPPDPFDLDRDGDGWGCENG